MHCDSLIGVAGFVLLLLVTTGVLLYLAYVIYDSQKFYKATMTRIANGEHR